MNKDTFTIKLKELPYSTLFATLITSKIFLLTLSLIASKSEWIFSYILATIVGLFLLHLISKILPFFYLLEASSKGISYITLFKKIWIPWDDFKQAKIEWDNYHGKNACIYDNNGRLKFRFLGTLALNCYRVGELLNVLKENYQGGRLKNDADLRLLMADYLSASKKNIQTLLASSTILLNDASKLNSLIATNNDWFILKFAHFPSRFMAIVLLFIALFIIPKPMVAALTHHHNWWIFLSYAAMLTVLAFLLFIAFMVKNLVFYNAKTHDAHRIVKVFNYYLLIGGKMNSISALEILKSSQTKNTYCILLTDTVDRILCKSYLMVTESRSVCKKLSEATQLPIIDPISKKWTNEVTLFFDFCNFMTIILLPALIIILYNKSLINMMIHSIKSVTT